MKSFTLYSFVLGVLLAQVTAFVIIDNKEFQQAYSEMSDGIGDFKEGLGDLFRKMSQSKKNPGKAVLDIVEEDEEEVGGAGIDDNIVYAINKTVGSSTKAAQELFNHLVKKTGVYKLGVPEIKEDSRLKDYIRYQMSNLLMGTSVMAAAMGNMMKN